jgi:hypothetical protein
MLQQCMDDSARRLAGEANALKEKNAALEHRLAEVAEQQRALAQKNEEERTTLLRRSDEDRREFLQRGDEQRRELLALQAKLGDHLGDAAKKVQPLPPPAVATATATSEGRSRTEGGAGAPPQPATVVLVTPPAAQASGPVSASATFVPGGSLPAACVVQPERAARAEAPVKKAGPSRQARTPDRSDGRRKQVAASGLPGCEPARTAQVVQAGQAAQGVQAAATSGEPASTGPATDPRPTAAMAAAPAPTPSAASPATDAGAVEPATAPGPGAPAAAAPSDGDGGVVETAADPAAAR